MFKAKAAEYQVKVGVIAFVRIRFPNVYMYSTAPLSSNSKQHIRLHYLNNQL